MKEENITPRPFTERPWLAFIVQTVLTIVAQFSFGGLGGYLGLVFLWDHYRTDFPIIEFFVGCFIGGIVGLLFGWRIGLNILRKYFIKTSNVNAIMISSIIISSIIYVLFFVLYFRPLFG